LTLIDGVAGALAISGGMRVDAATELREALKLRVEGLANVLIDLSEVRECDAAGKPFRVSAMSSAVRETAGALGIEWEGVVAIGTA
jgi:ABC-type transporter Mla MlaB component